MILETCRVKLSLVVMCFLVAGMASAEERRVELAKAFFKLSPLIAELNTHQAEHKRLLGLATIQTKKDVDVRSKLVEEILEIERSALETAAGQRVYVRAQFAGLARARVRLNKMDVNLAKSTQESNVAISKLKDAIRTDLSKIDEAKQIIRENAPNAEESKMLAQMDNSKLAKERAEIRVEESIKALGRARVSLGHANKAVTKELARFAKAYNFVTSEGRPVYEKSESDDHFRKVEALRRQASREQVAVEIRQRVLMEQELLVGKHLQKIKYLTQTLEGAFSAPAVSRNLSPKRARLCNWVESPSFLVGNRTPYAGKRVCMGEAVCKYIQGPREAHQFQVACPVSSKFECTSKNSWKQATQCFWDGGLVDKPIHSEGYLARKLNRTSEGANRAD